MSRYLLSSLKVKMCLFINSITKILVYFPYIRPYLGVEIGSSCEWQGWTWIKRFQSFVAYPFEKRHIFGENVTLIALYVNLPSPRVAPSELLQIRLAYAPASTSHPGVAASRTTKQMIGEGKVDDVFPHG